MWKSTMNSFFLLVFLSFSISEALFLPFNSSILQLPSQDIIIATGESNTSASLHAQLWPPLPLERYIRQGITINITAYGDTLSETDVPGVLQAMVALQRTILNIGKPNEMLVPITTAEDTKGGVYVNIGFYSLHPPTGVRIVQASDVLHKVWQLLMEYHPPREIAQASILLRDEGLALFRMSFRHV